MTFSSLETVKPIYILPRDNLVEEVLIPSFEQANEVKCMMGFFSSATLSELAPGLATFINSSTQSLRLIVSPFLRQEDREAIELGLKDTQGAGEEFLNQIIITEDLLQKYTLRCLAYLISQRRLEIKIALMKDALFHLKVWLFFNEDRILGVHGSGNMTQKGISKNFEQITVSKSWLDPTQNYIVEKLNYQFDRLC